MLGNSCTGALLVILKMELSSPSLQVKAGNYDKSGLLHA
jgi:hypothetical protein